MKRKDDAEERKQTEKEQQKSVERTHWTLEDKTASSDSASSSSSNKPKLIIEYDNSGFSEVGAIGRTSFRNFNKAPEATSTSTSSPSTSNKIPKLAEEHKKKK